MSARAVELLGHAHFENGDEMRPRMPWEEPPSAPTAMPREQLMAILQRQRALPPEQRPGRVKVADS